MFKINRYSIAKYQILFFGLLLITSSLIITSTFSNKIVTSDSDKFSIIDEVIRDKNLIPNQDEYSLDYKLIEHFVSGESETVEMNSLDSEEAKLSISMVSESDSTATLAGSNEIGLLVNNFAGPFESFLRSQLYHIDDDGDMFDSNYLLEYDMIGNRADFLYDGGADTVSDISVGDFDGNFREEVVVAYGRDNKLWIQLLENWAGLEFRVMANGSSGAMDQNAIAVATGNFDNDTKDEFVVLGRRASGPQIMIYDDVCVNTPNDIMLYGDKIILKTYENLDTFVYSPSSPSNSLYPNNMGGSLIASQMVFTIINAENQSFNGPVEYGDGILLQDAENRYWIADNGTNRVSVADLNTTTLVNHTFRILSERPGGNDVGVVYFNGFMALQSMLNTKYVTADMSFQLGLDTRFDQLNCWYKVHSGEDSRPNIYASDAIPIKTIYESNFEHLDALPRTNPQDLDTHLMPQTLVTGDIDGDNMDEIIVMGMDASNVLHAWVYDDIMNNYQKLHEFSWTDQNINPSVTVGDIDGDLRDEILFSISTASSGKVEIYEDALGGSKFTKLHTLTSIGDSLYGEVSRITTGDIDGDALDEIIVVNGSCHVQIYDDNYTQLASINNQHWKAGIPAINFFYPIDLTCGDINQDGKDDILLTTVEANGWDLVVNPSLGFLSTWSYNATSQDFKYESIMFSNDEPGYPVIEFPRVITGDFQADQFTVKYLEHKTWTAEEQIVCVMAAPPTHDGISQNYDNSGTGYGYATSSGQSGSVGASIGIGAYVAFEKELEATFFFSIKIAKFEAEASLMGKVGVSQAKSFVEVQTSSFSGDATYDYVIFTAIKYDRFIFQVLSAPDSSLEGSNMSMLYPQEVRLYKWDREYFNSHNSENAEDVDSSVLGHTVGDVPSYPSSDWVSMMHPARLQSSIMPVGKGGGTTAVEVAIGSETELEIETELEFEWKVGAGVGDFTFGLMGSIGAQSGWGWSWGEETGFSGEVGDIEDDYDYQTYNYEYGLFVYVKNYTPKAQKDYEPDGVLGVASDVLEILGTLSSLHMDEFGRGNGYYVIDYWVNVPSYFGQTIQQELDYASDMENVLTNFDIPGFTLLALLPWIPIIVAKRQNNRKTKE